MSERQADWFAVFDDAGTCIGASWDPGIALDEAEDTVSHRRLVSVSGVRDPGMVPLAEPCTAEFCRLARKLPPGVAIVRAGYVHKADGLVHLASDLTGWAKVVKFGPGSARSLDA